MNFLRRMERSDEVDDSFKKLIRKKVGGPRGKNFGRRENITKQKTRKELRKEMRKNKKSAKHTYILNKLGKLPEVAETTGKDKKKKRKRKRKNPYQKDEEENVLELTPLPKKKSGAEDSSSGDRDDRNSRGVLDEEMEQLKREMEESRRTRLLEENAHEDKFIRRMEKKLKLNKKAKIPASFKTDGLDYLLEICDNMSSKKKKEMKKGKEDNQDDSEDEDDDDAEQDDFDDEDMEVIPEDSGEDSEGELSGAEDDDEDEEMAGDSDDEENEEDIGEDMSDNSEESNDLGGGGEEDDRDSSEDEIKKKKKKTKQKAKTKKDDGIWEDIYGKLRRKDGSYVDEKDIEQELREKKSKSDVTSKQATTGKYVPPMKRQNQSQKEKISRSLKGLLNRLSEGNMHSISTQVEELYMTNSRNEMNECMLELLYAVLLSKVTMPERVILEHVMLIGTLHANIGTEIGAFFLQSFVTDFREKYEAVDSIEDNRELENLLQLISAMYQFKIIDACLVYDILNFMALNFTPKDVELILTCLRSVGFKLRKDDPIALKSLIIVIQEKATKSKSEGSSAKVKFMLEVVMAIRNNNMSKIPNYDPSIASHLQKLIKTHIHKGNYISVMKIKMDDLLNAKTKGRWWIVGSAWTNTSSSHQDEPAESNQIVTSTDSKMNEKLLKKARALGMNTETRKNVFSILMTAEDYMDAFEKLNHLDLKNNQERELIHVSTYCCLHEKKFNPYYAYIVSKFCSMERKFMVKTYDIIVANLAPMKLTLQYNLWDRLKDLPSLKSFQLKNLAKLLVHLINDKSLPLSTLKVIEYAEMDKIKLKFLNDVLTGILMQKHEENIQEIFLKIAMSEKLSVFRESLRLFLCHFMVQKSIETSDGETITNDLSEDQMELLKDRIKVAETTLLVGKGRVLL